MKMFYIGVLSYFGIPPEQFTQVCKHVVPHSLSSTAIHNNLLTLTGPLLVDNSLILITYCQPVHISLHLYTGLQILNSYRKIPKISPGAYIFGGAYLRREIDWASLIFGGKFTRFCFVLLCTWGQFSQYKSPGLYLEGRFNGGLFALPVWGVYIWRGLYMEGLIFGILRYSLNCHVLKKFCVKELLQLIMESQHN